jgi:hypothetical protein
MRTMSEIINIDKEIRDVLTASGDASKKQAEKRENKIRQYEVHAQNAASEKIREIQVRLTAEKAAELSQIEKFFAREQEKIKSAVDENKEKWADEIFRATIDLGLRESGEN